MQQLQTGHLSLAPPPTEVVPDPAGSGVALQPVAVRSERRPTWATLASLAVITGVAALALGGWVLVDAWTGTSGPPTRSTALERTVSVLADPGLSRVPFSGSAGRIVLLVGERGDAVLMLRGLSPAPRGQAYQAWITLPGSAKISPAGLFDGSEPFVPLVRRVTPGARASVTLEDEAGAATPSRRPRLVAVRAKARRS